MSLPLLNGPFTANQGVNMHHLPAKGHNAPSEMLTRKLNQVAANLVSGPMEGNLKTILGEKDICNDLMTIFIGDKQSLMFSLLGQAFTVTYCHAIDGKMTDQFWLASVSPAPIKDANVRPDTSRSYLDQREYTYNIRQANMLISGEVVEFLYKIRSQIHEFDVSHVTGLEGDGWGIRNVAKAEEIEKYARDIESQLGNALAPGAWRLKKALESGVVDEAKMILVRGSLPQALAQAVTKYMPSITDHSPGLWQTETELYRSLLEEYEANSMALTYGLAKNPYEFIANLIETGADHVQKLVYDNNDNAVIFRRGSTEPTQIKGILMVSSQTFKFLKKNPGTKNQLEYGKFYNSKPVYHKPWAGLAANDPNKTLRVIHDVEGAQSHSPSDGAALEQLIQTTLDPRKYPPPENPTVGLLTLTDKGEKLLANQPLTSGRSTRPSKSEIFKLGTYDLSQECCFVMYGHEAVVVAQVEEQINGTQKDVDGRSPSLKSVEKVIFRASVGDLNHDHDLMKSWAKFICEGRDRHQVPTSISASSYFTTKNVSIHTPAVSSQQLTFGTNEVKTVMLDPSLYDPVHLADALNANLERLHQLKGSALEEVSFLNGSLTDMMDVAEKAVELFKSYFQKVQYNTLAQNIPALKTLYKIELTPFHTVVLDSRGGEGGNDRRIKFLKRPFYHALPIVDTNVINARASVLLNSTVTISTDMLTTNNALTAFVGKNVFTGKLLTAKTVRLNGKVIRGTSPTPDAPAPIETVLEKNIAELKRLADIFYKQFCTWILPHEKKELNFLFTTDASVDKTWFIIKYVLLPILTKGRVKFINEGAIVFADMTKDSVTVMEETDDSYSMFNDDAHHTHHKEVMSARTFWITTKSNWPLIVQVTALMMEYWYITPYAMGVQIDMGVNTGYAVDFVKEESVYSEQALYTCKNAFELILSPVGKVVEEGADSSIDIISSCQIMTTRNTLGAGSVIANTVVPTPNAICKAVARNGSPVISTDFISRTSSGSLETLLDDMKELTERDRQIITHQLKQPLAITRDRNMVNSDNGGDTEQFVGLLRPARMSTSANIPLMGLVSDLIPAKTSNVSGWMQFYSSSRQSTNPYASNFGGLISMRYTPSYTMLGEEGNSLLLKTTSVPGDEIICSTTARLERLYNFNIEKNILSPEECNYILTDCCRHCPIPNHNNARLNTAPVGKVTRANTASVTTELGLAVPYTQTTQPCKQKQSVKIGDIPSLRVIGPTDHTIISPFTVPNISSTV